MTRGSGLAVAQKLHVNVGSEAHVVSEVPTNVIGILIDHDLIVVPQPVAAEADVDRGHAEVEATKPKSTGPAAGQSPDVAFAEAAGEAPVLEGMIQMESRIILTAIVSNPFVAGRVDVRRFGMAGLVGEILMFGWCGGVFLGSASRGGTVRRNVSAADALHAGSMCATAMLLCDHRKRQKQRYGQESKQFVHGFELINIRVKMVDWGGG
jgi:hypothetical protein